MLGRRALLSTATSSRDRYPAKAPSLPPRACPENAPVSFWLARRIIVPGIIEGTENTGQITQSPPWSRVFKLASAVTQCSYRAIDSPLPAVPPVSAMPPDSSRSSAAARQGSRTSLRAGRPGTTAAAQQAGNNLTTWVASVMLVKSRSVKPRRQRPARSNRSASSRDLRSRRRDAHPDSARPVG